MSLPGPWDSLLPWRRGAAEIPTGPVALASAGLAASLAWGVTARGAELLWLHDSLVPAALPVEGFCQQAQQLSRDKRATFPPRQFPPRRLSMASPGHPTPSCSRRHRTRCFEGQL